MPRRPGHLRSTIELASRPEALLDQSPPATAPSFVDSYPALVYRAAAFKPDMTRRKDGLIGDGAAISPTFRYVERVATCRIT